MKMNYDKLRNIKKDTFSNPVYTSFSCVQTFFGRLRYKILPFLDWSSITDEGKSLRRKNFDRNLR